MIDEKLIIELVREMTYKDAPRTDVDGDDCYVVELTESLENLLRAVYGCNKF